MLQPMQQPADASPTLSAASFAALLASLAAPEEETAPEPVAPAAEDAHAEDVAILSYEQALRAHARYRPVAAGALPRRSPAASRATPSTLQSNKKAGAPGKPERRSTVPRESRKSASITIRLTGEEAAQLRERAAEAGLTASAYLRSCAFEVEALRTQVKQALSEIRSAAPAEEQRSPGQAFPPQPTWRARLFPRWAGAQRAAHA